MITRLNPSRLLPLFGLAAAIVTGVLASASVANAQASFAVLHSFTGPDGAQPHAGLIQGPDGTLYGTTYYGGASNVGTIFQMAPDGSGYAVLHSFTGPDGSGPNAGLIQGPDGTLYGTTFSGGVNGTVFQMAPDGSGYALLHSFTGAPDGSNPDANLFQGPDGTLYGTTVVGGAGGCVCGTVFQMAPDGSGYAVVHSFGGPDGSTPAATLIQGLDGTLYGTTGVGGASSKGTVFQMAPDGSSYTLLHQFTGPDGSGPSAGLIQGPDGTLYGTTYYGGASNVGTIFQMAPDGSGYAVLHSFTGGLDGSGPAASLIQGPDGTLYGTTAGGAGNVGTIFQMGPDGSGYAVLHNFGGTDGSNPNAGLIQGPDGTLYGTAYAGGTSGGGVVFQLTLSPSAATRR